jgi:sestrin
MNADDVSLCLLQVQELYVDAFLHNNRLEHMVQVMSYHPDYLACFLKTQQYMLRCYGPLPYDYRHYIAIMVSELSAA